MRNEYLGRKPYTGRPSIASMTWRCNIKDSKALDVDGFVMVFPTAKSAALAAAAPALLSALERLLDSQRGLDLAAWQQAVADARTAIAAARGER